MNSEAKISLVRMAMGPFVYRLEGKKLQIIDYIKEDDCYELQEESGDSYILHSRMLESFMKLKKGRNK